MLTAQRPYKEGWKLDEFKDQLAMGEKVEREHAPTVAKIKEGKIKTLDEIAKSIAQDHLKEDPKYYDKLAEAKLSAKDFAETSVETREV